MPGKMQAADAMVDAVKEATRKVKMQEERMVKMEDRAEGIEQQLEDVAEMRRLADRTRADTDDILPRLTTAESNVADLLAKVSEAQAQADEAHEVGECAVCADAHVSNTQLLEILCPIQKTICYSHVSRQRCYFSDERSHLTFWQRINGLKEELDYERDERVRIEDEHAESVQYYLRAWR
jgi:hypothetical protein